MPTPSLAFELIYPVNVQRTAYQQPYKAVITQRPFHHSIAQITIDGEPWSSERYLTGFPVSITFGEAGGPQANFIGYVNHLERVKALGSRTENQFFETVVTCIGASSIFKATDFGVFTDLTVPDIIKRKADRYRFSVRAQEDESVWPSLSQMGESDWKFVSDIARRAGLVLFSSGTTIYLATRGALIRSAFESGIPPVFSASPGNSNPSAQRVAMTNGQENPDNPLRLLEVHGLDMTSREVLSFLEDPTDKVGEFLGAIPPSVPELVRRDIQARVASIADAKRSLVSLLAESTFFNQGQLDLPGDARIHHASLVRLDATFGTAEEGLWFVDKSVHELRIGANVFRQGETHSSYSTTVEVSRDSSGALDATTIPSTGPALGFTDPPPSILVDNVWRSAFGEAA